MGVKVLAEAVKVDEASKPRVRDRIFETACELFYKHGIRAVGVDAIANEAGTNKMSFYRSFPSKDELVAEYLREQEREYFEWWDATIAPHAGDPLAQLYALFNAYLGLACPKAEEDMGCRTSRGCALGNAAVEIPEDNADLNSIVHEYKTKIRRRLRKLARDTGARDPEGLGDALMLLMEGGYYTRLTFPQNSGPIVAITKAARNLIESHLK